MRTATSLLAGLGLLLCANQAQANKTPETLKAEFIQTQLQKGFDETQVRAYLDQARLNQAVLDAISRPWEAKPWHQYFPIFLTDKRLAAGVDFWHQHRRSIEKAAAQYSVDPQIIVAIIGIETFYGQFAGTYPVLDALYTLGFYYPPRADFFRDQLSQLQQLIAEEGLDLASLKGSYAGAMGFGQFIPSSYRHFAVDFNKDGKRDLLGNADDAIGSVANYFHQHGWQKAAPVALPLAKRNSATVSVTPWAGEAMTLKVADILSPTLALAQNQDLDVSQPGLLIKLEQPEHDEYWLGLNNFYVITRYNRSPLYAMAVYQFSEQLKHAHASN